MTGVAEAVILLRRRDYGDDDLITVFFSRGRGKLTAIAKSAKKSRKRFGGTLELFSVLSIVTAAGRGRGLSILREASLQEAFPGIRADILKMAYASYWVEMVDEWMEPGQVSPELFDLLAYVLRNIDSGNNCAEFLSILFQLRFMIMAGFSPDLDGCTHCRLPLERFESGRSGFDLQRGGLVCPRCGPGVRGMTLSRGTLKELRWVARGDLEKAGRIRFSQWAVEEGLRLLEAFVPFHLGKDLRSLKFLRQIRLPAVPADGRRTSA
jgi:DNA repair protein RecO (recombination protein O)